MYFRIKEARKFAKLTQRELADQLGIKVSTLSGYEIGAHDPKSNMLAEIARICGTTVDYLLGIDYAQAEKKPAIPEGMTDEETRFIDGVKKLTPANRRLFLGILALLLKEQEQNPDSPD